MCGRMNISNDPNVQAFMDALGISSYPANNSDLRPTDSTLLLVPSGGEVVAKDMSWGIKPSWSKQLLINAKFETIAEKNTFKGAFESQRALVVCSGWYEWKTAGEKNSVKKPAPKQKYLVEHSLKQLMLMAAVYYPAHGQQSQDRFVTLTTAPNERLKQVHHRMPVIIHADEMDTWLLGCSEGAKPLMHAIKSEAFRVNTC
jgi:putative SOS response-associated peptidase YedK